jgi:hypothetical protein
MAARACNTIAFTQGTQSRLGPASAPRLPPRKLMPVQKSSVSFCFDAVMTAGSFADPVRWPPGDRADSPLRCYLRTIV